MHASRARNYIPERTEMEEDFRPSTDHDYSEQLEAEFVDLDPEIKIKLQLKKNRTAKLEPDKD